MHHARSSIAIASAVILAAAVTVAVVPGARAAGADTYAIDPVHTRVMFAVSHAGFSNAIGTVTGSTGSLVFDPDDWRSARLDVSVPIARLDLGDAKWNAATLAANLLDGARYPDARFVSDTVEPVEADNDAEADVASRVRVCGQLTLRGISRPLCMDVVLNALKRHPLPPFRRTAGFSATATLSRSDYGVSAWKSLIGDSVELRIEVEAVRGGAAGSSAATPDVTSELQDPTPAPASARDEVLPPFPATRPEPPPPPDPAPEPVP